MREREREGGGGSHFLVKMLHYLFRVIYNKITLFLSILHVHTIL